MRELTWYYVSRAVIAVAPAAIAWTATHAIWLAGITWVLVMAGFVWYARSGHFIVDPRRPLTPLRRDEREQAITYRAATYAFVAVVLLLGLVGVLDLSTAWVSVVLLAGFMVYFAARAWLRHGM